MACVLCVETVADGCMGADLMATTLFADDEGNIHEFWKREIERDNQRVFLAGDWT